MSLVYTLASIGFTMEPSIKISVTIIWLSYTEAVNLYDSNFVFISKIVKRKIQHLAKIYAGESICTKF